MLAVGQVPEVAALPKKRKDLMLSPMTRRIICATSAACCATFLVVLVDAVEGDAILKLAIGESLLMVFMYRTVIRPSSYISVEGQLAPLVPISTTRLSRIRLAVRWSLPAYAAVVASWIWLAERGMAARPRFDDLHATALAAAVIGMPVASLICTVAVLGDAALRTPPAEQGYPWLYRMRTGWFSGRRSEGRRQRPDVEKGE